MAVSLQMWLLRVTYMLSRLCRGRSYSNMQLLAMPEPKRTKTESLSLRLDPKTKFILEFVARINGQSITTVVERAIKRASEDVGIAPKWDNRGNELEIRNWTTYWDQATV